MKLVGRKLLADFVQRHADVRDPLGAWIAEVEDAAWTEPADVKARFPNASFLSDNKVMFNIKGNRYRLKVLLAYRTQSVVIQKIGTHAEYDRW